MTLNYILLPDDYVLSPLRRPWNADDEQMDLDDAVYPEDMEVDLLANEQMDVDVAPNSPHIKPMDVDIAMPNEDMDIDPIPGRFVNLSDRIKVSSALVVGGMRVSRRPRRNRVKDSWRAVSQLNATAHKLSKIVGPRFEIANVASSSQLKAEDKITTARGINLPVIETFSADHAAEAPLCVQTTSVLSVLGPVQPSKVGDESLLSSGQIPGFVADENSVTQPLGRHVDNESATSEVGPPDRSYLAVAYSPAEDTDNPVLEIDFAEALTSYGQLDIVGHLSPIGKSKINDGFFLTSGGQTPDLAIDNRWLKTSRTPGRNIDNGSVMFEDPYVDYSYLAAAYPPTEDTDPLFPEIDFAEAETSFSHDLLAPETPCRTRRITYASLRQPKIDLFLTYNRRTPDLAVGDRWLKISRTPGRNIDNESVMFEDPYADYSYLAAAYPPTEDTDAFFPEIDFAEAETSFSQPDLLAPETSCHTRRRTYASVRKSEIDLFLTSNRRTPDLAVGDRWLKISRTPGRNIDNESVMFEDPYVDYSYLAAAYPPTEDIDTLFPEIDFAEAETSFNQPNLSTPETPRRVPRIKYANPLSPVRQSELDHSFFLTSNRQTPNLAVGDRWLKISRTPGRNIDNDSVMFEDDYADFSYLAIAYPYVDSEPGVDETSLPSDPSGCLTDDSPSSFSRPSWSSEPSFGYLADESSSSHSICDASTDFSACSSYPDIRSVPQAIIADDSFSKNEAQTYPDIELLDIQIRDLTALIREGPVGWSEATQDSGERSFVGTGHVDGFAWEYNTATCGECSSVWEVPEAVGGGERQCGEEENHTRLLTETLGSYDEETALGTCPNLPQTCEPSYYIDSYSVSQNDDGALLSNSTADIKSTQWSPKEFLPAGEAPEDIDYLCSCLEKLTLAEGESMQGTNESEAEINHSDLLSTRGNTEENTRSPRKSSSAGDRGSHVTLPTQLANDSLELDVDELEDDLLYIYSLPY